MKRIVFAALVVFLVASAAAYAGERPTLQKALQAKQADLWENVAKHQPKPIPQWCDHSCANTCLEQWNECEFSCQQYYPPSICNPYCDQVRRNCLCVNQCCQPPSPDYCE